MHFLWNKYQKNKYVWRHLRLNGGEGVVTPNPLPPSRGYATVSTCWPFFALHWILRGNKGPWVIKKLWGPQSRNFKKFENHWARRLWIVRDFSSIYPIYNDVKEVVRDFWARCLWRHRVATIMEIVRLISIFAPWTYWIREQCFNLWLLRPKIYFMTYGTKYDFLTPLLNTLRKFWLIFWVPVLHKKQTI